MPRVRCRYIGCIHLDNGFCGAPVIELDPDDGCHSFAMPSTDLYDEDDWEDEDEELDGWEEGYDDEEDEDEDDWLAEDDEF